MGRNDNNNSNKSLVHFYIVVEIVAAEVFVLHLQEGKNNG